MFKHQQQVLVTLEDRLEPQPATFIGPDRKHRGFAIVEVGSRMTIEHDGLFSVTLDSIKPARRARVMPKHPRITTILRDQKALLREVVAATLDDFAFSGKITLADNEAGLWLIRRIVGDYFDDELYGTSEGE